MIVNLALAVLLFLTPPAASWAWDLRFRYRPWTPRFYQGWAMGAGSECIVLMIEGQWNWVSLSAPASLALALVLWWLSRRKGKKKALRALSAKARARLAAMV